MQRNITTLFITSILIIGVTGWTNGNRVGQNGHNAHTSAGNIDVYDNGLAGDLNATNGNISIGSHAKVKTVEVTNGNISIDDFSQANSLETYNGNIDFGEKVIVAGNVETVNGNISLGQGVEVGANLTTTTGDIKIAPGSIIKGDIIFEKPGVILSHFEKETPILTIAKDVTIIGKIHLYRNIDLHLDSSINSDKVIRHYSDNR